jgi:CMP-N-acetylneuraminic acid synthetase
MQFPVKERAQKLRQEIAEITNANQSYVNSNRTNVVAAAEQERRLQRLLEILDELRTLTDWKKT